MKKKLLTLIIALLAMVACSFVVAGCSLQPSESNSGDSDTIQTPSDENNNSTDADKSSDDKKSEGNNKPSEIVVTGIALNLNSCTLEVGGSGMLIATVSPSNATNKTVTWKSSDSKVATVVGGRVSALKAGTVLITATCGGKSKTCVVSVRAKEEEKPTVVPVTSVSLNKTSLSLEIGESATLTATVSPGNATNKTATWKSSNNSVARVADGEVTALKAGTATITATCGGKSATCRVTVTESEEQEPTNIPVTSVTLNSNSLSLEVNDSETLTATILPSNATNKTVNWKSSNNSVATVVDGEVTALKAGAATVTATCGGKSASCLVTIKENTNGIEFVEYGSGYAVAKYTGTETSVTVPSTYKGKQVIAIGAGGGSGFAYCDNIEKVTIPSSVTTINYAAFLNCHSLKEVVIPDSVSTIGGMAFRDCISLTEFSLTGNIASMGLWVLQGCNSIQKLTLSSLNLKMENIFYTSTVPISLKEIVILGGSSIPEGALYGCSGLESLTIPFVGESINSKNPFGYIFGKTEFPNSYTTYLYYFPKDLKNATIIGGGIPDYAFQGCTTLTNITIPDRISSIGKDAFSSCKSFENVYYKGDIASWCAINGLESITRSGQTKLYIGNKEIKGDIIIPNGVKTIEKYAFNFCNELTSIKIPDSVISIGEGAFKKCSGLTSLAIPDSVTTIGDWACYECSNLTSVTIGNSVTSIGEGAFNKCSGMKSLAIPDGVTKIGDWAFEDCSNLTNVTIGSNVRYIGKSAFFGCKILTSVTFKVYNNWVAYNVKGVSTPIMKLDLEDSRTAAYYLRSSGYYSSYYYFERIY